RWCRRACADARGRSRLAERDARPRTPPARCTRAPPPHIQSRSRPPARATRALLRPPRSSARRCTAARWTDRLRVARQRRDRRSASARAARMLRAGRSPWRRGRRGSRCLWPPAAGGPCGRAALQSRSWVSLRSPHEERQHPSIVPSLLAQKGGEEDERSDREEEITLPVLEWLEPESTVGQVAEVARRCSQCTWARKAQAMVASE